MHVHVRIHVRLTEKEALMAVKDGKTRTEVPRKMRVHVCMCALWFVSVCLHVHIYIHAHAGFVFSQTGADVF